MTIEPIEIGEDISGWAALIAASFTTVAQEMGLTEENAPTHPSFMSTEILTASLQKGMCLFGMIDGAEKVGCVAIEAAKSGERTFYIERLAVLPDRRHRGYGKALLDFATAEIRKRGGERVSIAIIDEQTVLKEWYLGYGFRETGKKRFPHLPFTVCFLELRLKVS